MKIFKVNILDRTRPILDNGKCQGYERIVLEIESDTAQNACQVALDKGYEVIWDNPIDSIKHKVEAYYIK